MSGAQGAPDAPVRLGAGRRSVRLPAALVLGVSMWIATFVGFFTVLLPARLAILAPDEKVPVLATIAVVGSIVALLANIVFGALSDLTRSRFGRRNPWIVVGSIGSFASLSVVSTTENVTTLVVAWCVFQLFLNAIVAPLVTVIPDRVPESSRGSYSALYGVSMTIGATVGQLVASRFVGDPQRGMWVLAAVVLVCGPLFAGLAPEESTKDVPRREFSPAMLLASFSFPMKQARDFYLALSGKLLFVLGSFSITGYQVYILTDYMQADTATVGNTIAMMSIITLVTGLVFGAGAGPVSDRIKRRKVLVMGSALLVAVAMAVPLLVAKPWAMVVYALIAGVGSGIYNSVDQALNYEVLPDPGTAAKDLGILNMANTGGQIMGPALTSAVVGASGGYALVFVVAAGVLVASAALIKPIRKAR